MEVTLVVLVVAALVAAGSFALSLARGPMDPIDPVVEERAVVRFFWHHPKVRHFFARRFDRNSAGGFLLTISFIVVFGVALVLGALLDMVDENEGLARLDRSVSEWGSRHADSRSVDILSNITELGSTKVVFAILALVAVVDYLRRRNRDVIAFVAVVGLGEWIINNGLKWIVDRDRPDVLHLVSAGGSSFPSGHSAAAAAGWAAIALVLGRGRPRRTQAVIAAAAGLITIAVATSRALLGVHWLTDVIGGVAVGWGWFTLVAVMFGGRQQRLGDPAMRGAATHPPRHHDAELADRAT